jgi:TolB-like protein
MLARRVVVQLAFCVCTLIACGASAQKKPLRIAVMDFTPAATSPEFAPLGAGLQSMITTDLSQVSAFVLVERARLRDIEAELKLHESGMVDKDTAAKIGGLAGATHLLVGSFTVVGGKMRLDARLFAVATGEVLATEKMEGAQATFFELEKSLVKRVVDAVGVRLAKREKTELAKPATQSFDAFQKYSEGLVAFDAQHTEAAITAMKAAVAADAGFALAAQKLAELERLVPAVKLPEVKAPQSCQPNPLQTASCSPAPGQAPPPDFRAPTSIVGDGPHPLNIVVSSGGDTAPCVTPCQLNLPKGPFQIEVLGPTHYTQTLQAPGGPASVSVSQFNKTNVIIGSVLAGVGVILTATSIGLHEANASTHATAQELWPLPLSLSAGLLFPSVYYLLKMGKNTARVTSF